MSIQHDSSGRWFRKLAAGTSLLFLVSMAIGSGTANAETRIVLPMALDGAPLVSNAVPVTPRPAEPTEPATAPPSPTATSGLPVVPTTPPTAEPDDCPDSDFLEVTAHPLNDEYPDPELAVSCEDDLLIVESNGIPMFEFTPITPNDLAAQEYRWQVPLEPTALDESVDIPFLGPVAILVDGLPIYGPNEAPTQGSADPYLDEILDFCNGHTAMRGDYHYHALAGCLFGDLSEQVDRVLGYSFDGYPIVSPWVCDAPDCETVKQLGSSWRRTSDVRAAWDAHEYIEGSGDLDRCNGMVGPDGEYRYYATASFPYFLGCYVGEAIANGGGAGGPGGGGGRPPRPLLFDWLGAVLR